MKLKYIIVISSIFLLEGGICAEKNESEELNNSEILKLIANDIAVAEVKVIRESDEKLRLKMSNGGNQELGFQEFAKVDIQIIKTLAYKSNDKILVHSLTPGKNVSCLIPIVDVKGMHFVEVGSVEKESNTLVLLEEIEVGSFRFWRLVKFLSKADVELLVKRK